MTRTIISRTATTWKNFHRVVVHGSSAPMEWLKLTIKPGESDGRESANSFGPFSWQRMVQSLP